MTDAQIHKHRLLFYRKPIWRVICSQMSTRFVENKIFGKVFDKKCVKKCRFGPFAFKYLPKKAGFRPILTNIDYKDRKIEKMNSVLKPYLAVLQSVFDENPNLLG